MEEVWRELGREGGQWRTRRRSRRWRTGEPEESGRRMGIGGVGGRGGAERLRGREEDLGGAQGEGGGSREALEVLQGQGSRVGRRGQSEAHEEGDEQPRLR
eukprot:1271069-Pyramimonas_sp.AAC.1